MKSDIQKQPDSRRKHSSLTPWRVFLGISLMFSIVLMSVAPAMAPGGEEIRWRKGRRLVWDDFEGRPDRGSRMDALTESGISFSWGCDWRGFDAKIYAMFVPDRSWVKEGTPLLLAHEQAHFDITELHARKLRKYFGTHRNPCSLGQNGINNAAKKIIDASHKMQDDYDRATRHGENRRAQADWQRQIADALQAHAKWVE